MTPILLLLVTTIHDGGTDQEYRSGYEMRYFTDGATARKEALRTGRPLIVFSGQAPKEVPGCILLKYDGQSFLGIDDYQRRMKSEVWVMVFTVYESYYEEQGQKQMKKLLEIQGYFQGEGSVTQIMTILIKRRD